MIYIMLCNMTQNTRDRQMDLPNLLEYATHNVGDENNRVLSYYATLGRYDLIINSEADSVLEAAQLSVALSNMTGMNIETLPTMNMHKIEEQITNEMPVPMSERTATEVPWVIAPTTAADNDHRPY